MVITSTVVEALCPRVEIRSATLTLYPSSFPLRIENRKVVANMPSGEEYSLLFIRRESLELLIYDPRAKHFICWNPKRTRLVAKRNFPKEKLPLCTFVEKASELLPQTLRNYVSTYRNRTVTIKMSPRGIYASRNELRLCERTKKNAKRKKSCAGNPEFLLSGCSDGRRRFCDETKKLHHHKGVLFDLKQKHCFD